MFLDENGRLMAVAYMAGYEMFYEDALERAARMKALCEQYGIIGIYPPQEEPEDEFAPYVPKDDSHPEMAQMYFTRDINHIRRSDMVIAELDGFYGQEVESGTAFECGVAAALGKRLYGYMADTRPLKAHSEPLQVLPDGREADAAGIAVEDFDLPVQVLFHDFTIIEGTFEDALKRIRADLDAELAAEGAAPFQIKK